MVIALARIIGKFRLVAGRNAAFHIRTALCTFDTVSTNRLDHGSSHVRTSGGWLHLAPVIDVCSRRVVGYSMSTEQNTKLSLAALTSSPCSNAVIQQSYV